MFISGIFFVSGLLTFAEPVLELPPPADDLAGISRVSEGELITPRNIEFSLCVKHFDFPVEKLFYLSIAALNANKF